MIEPLAGKRDWVLRATLALSTVAAYWPLRRAAFINLDDPGYVTNNRMVQQGLTAEGLGWAFTTGHLANWHPLTWLSHMLDCTLFGLSPTGPHLVNVALHVCNVLLLFHVLGRMTGAAYPSAWVAGLFALHPAHVESVAWISERKDVLSTLFWFLSLWAYARWVESPRPARYAGVAALLALGLMCKPMLVTGPFVLLLFDVWPLARIGPQASSERRIPFRKAIVEKVPLLGVVITASVVTFIAQSQRGAVLPLGRASIAHRAAHAIVSYSRYLSELVWPARLGVYYPTPAAWPAWRIAASAGLLVAITVVAWIHRTRRPYLLIGWLFFLGTLVPVIGLVQVGGQSMADRYTYVPFIGVFVMVVWWLAEMAGHYRMGRLALAVPCTAVLAALGVATFRQASFWIDNETLFRHTLASSNLFNDYAEYEVGVELLKRHDLAQARKHFEMILRVDPSNARGNSGLGVVLAEEGKRAEAAGHFELALQADHEDHDSHRNLGIILAERGQEDDAAKHFEDALRIDPSDAVSHQWMGRILAKKGDLLGATAHLQSAVQGAPSDPSMRYSLATVLVQQHRGEEALPHLKELRRLANDNPTLLGKLGASYASLGLPVNAAEAYERALQLKPGNAPLQAALGTVLAESGRLDEGVALLQAALQKQPDDPTIQFNLATALLSQGKTAEALEHYESAIRLGPNDGKTRMRVGGSLVVRDHVAEAKHFLLDAVEADLSVVPQYFDLVKDCVRREKREEGSSLLQGLLGLAARWREEGKADNAAGLEREVRRVATDLALTDLIK